MSTPDRTTGVAAVGRRADAGPPEGSEAVAAAFPFQDIGADPAVEEAGFAPIKHVPEAPPRTLADRWNDLSPRRQKVVIGVGLALTALGSLAWSGSPVSLPPPPAPAAELIPPPPQQRTYYLAVTAVAENTLITAENFDQLFEQHRAAAAPQGAVAGMPEAVGRYVVRPLNRSQVLTGADLGPSPVPTVVEPPAPRPPTVERHVVRVITASGIRISTYEHAPGGEWQMVAEQFQPGR